MTAENRSRDGGNVWLILLIALALIATVIMLFSDSAKWLQVALLAALWAAVMGFMMVTRSRGERDKARELLEAREREHQAELQALYARNDADRAALDAARASEGLPPATSSADAEVLREIREELAALRTQLEDLAGREFGYEPAALQAEARRIREIEARTDNVEAPANPQPQSEPNRGSEHARSEQASHQVQHGQHTQSAEQPREKEQVQTARPSAPTQPTQPTQAPQSSSRWVAPGSNDVTTRIAPVRDPEEDEAISALSSEADNTDTPAAQESPSRQAAALGKAAETQQRAEQTHVAGAPSSDAVAGRVGSHRAPEGRNPLTDLIRERQEELERERAQAEQRRRAEEEQRRRSAEERRRAEEEQRRRAEEQAASESQDHRGRRRADERGTGALSVAELLERNKRS